MRMFLFSLGMLSLVCFPSHGVSEPAYSVHTEYVRWEISATGRTLSFLDTGTGAELLAADGAGPFCRIHQGGVQHAVSRVTVDDDILRLSFGESGVEATLGIEVHPRYFVLSVLSLSGDEVDEMVLLDVPLVLNGAVDDAFAACVLARNLQTRVLEIPGPSTRLRAFAYKRFGIPGASVAVLACPTPSLRELMKEVVVAADDLPRHRDSSHPPIGGPWALDAPINRGSYLFDFGALTEDTVDAWIDLVRQIGFNQIDFHTGTSFRFGDYTPNPRLFPQGRDSVKAVIDKLHAAGIAAGLHTYAFFIAKDSPYVTPVPDPRLGKAARFTLADAITAEATHVPVLESTAEVSTVTGFFARNSVTLQIGDELIIFSDVAGAAPFGFMDCRRGAHGTAATAHQAGAPVYQLKECFGLFAPDADSTLPAEIAANTAELFNECGFDMIYLDALDGEDILAGHEHGWHYGSKFVFEIANRLDRPALFEMSTFHHHLWYVRARMGAWDHPARSHKRFIDVHCAANVAGAGMFLPMNLGWWAVKTWQDGTASVWSEPTFPDDIEYLLCKALGHDMGLSLMGVNPGNIGTIPLYQRLTPLFQRYETLRHSGAAPESIKMLLREPGREFTLDHTDDGDWQFRPVAYYKHKVNSAAPWDTEWTVHNHFDEQPVRVRIEALMAAVPYDSEDAVVIETFSDPAGLTLRSVAEHVEATLTRDTQLVKAGEASGRFTAANDGDKASGAWVQAGRVYNPPLNIADAPALGFWVYGDGSGALLNVQVLSARHTGAGGIGDRYVSLDFNGWRYVALIEFEGGRIADYLWPYGDPYSIYREPVDFSAVESFSLWYNNIPAGETVSCVISPVKALPLVRTAVRNPVLIINGREIRFPAVIESGACLEFHAPDDCVLYGPKGEVIERITLTGDVPILDPGANTIVFSCDDDNITTPRARVTIISSGTPLTP